MSRMSELDAELRAAGIDPEGMDLERVAEYWELVGHIPTFIEAAKELHKPREPIP